MFSDLGFHIDFLQNFRLVLVHHIDGNMMEKYYLGGFIFLSFALNIPVYALNHFGFVILRSASFRV